jgi:hypothetical protein
VRLIAMDYFKEKYNKCNRLHLVDKNFDFIADKIQIAYSHRERYFLTRISCIFQQSNKAATYNSRVASSRQNLNVMIETYREGKTQDPSCVAWYTHTNALC